MERNIQMGDVVTLRPPCDCPERWRPLAEHLEGKTFQVTGTARTTSGDVLVLQPWPCVEIYPSFQLAPAECLQKVLGEAEVAPLDNKGTPLDPNEQHRLEVT